MRIAVVSLTSHVSLTLMQERGGWRFSRWERHFNPISVQPSEEDCRREFRDPESAASYFRLHYGWRLEVGLPKERKSDSHPAATRGRLRSSAAPCEDIED